jgi:hypothetical protein
MAKSIRVGTMLIADGTRTPKLVILGTQSYSTGLVIDPGLHKCPVG